MPPRKKSQRPLKVKVVSRATGKVKKGATAHLNFDNSLMGVARSKRVLAKSSTKNRSTRRKLLKQ